jgi:hypothetical protein
LSYKRIMESGEHVGEQLCREEKSLQECMPLLSKLTNTFDAIPHPAFSAATLEASWDVQTRGVHVTVVGTNFTLVHI